MHQLIEQDWLELPYTMMRLTAGARSQDAKRFYWRDLCVHCGDITLNLVSSRSEDGTSFYTAIYSVVDYSRGDFRRDFLIPAHPSPEDHQTRWSVPALSDKANLTRKELAEVLLSQLVAFSVDGFSQPMTTSLDSPDPTSESSEQSPLPGSGAPFIVESDE